jgi:hypothetical protein
VPQTFPHDILFTLWDDQIHNFVFEWKTVATEGDYLALVAGYQASDTYICDSLDPQVDPIPHMIDEHARRTAPTT